MQISKYTNKVLAIGLMFGISAFANITGKVVDQSSLGLSGVKVQLVGTNESVISDSHGLFSIAVADGSTPNVKVDKPESFFQNGNLQINVSGNYAINATLYSVLGFQIATQFEEASNQNHDIKLFDNLNINEGVYLLKLHIGNDIFVKKVRINQGQFEGSQSSGFTKITKTNLHSSTVSKSLDFSLIGYQTKNIVLTSDTQELGDVELIAVTSSSSQTSSSSSSTISAPVAQNLTITGTMAQGFSLVGNYTYFDAEGDLEVGTQFGWMRDEIPLAPFVKEYYVEPGDIGQDISFIVIPTTATGTLTEGIMYKKTLHAPIAASVFLSGTATKDSTLTGHYTYSDADGDLESNSTFQWYRGEDAISGANSLSYTVTALDSAKSIRFEVVPRTNTGINLQGLPGAASVIAEEGFARPEARNVTITGTPTQDSTLSIHYTYYDADGDPTSVPLFKWYRGTDLIAGATSSTYAIQYADSGKVISGEITPQSQSSVNSIGAPVKAASTTVTGFTPPEAQNTTIVGSPAQNGILTATYDYYDAEGDQADTTRFQWYRGGTLIADGTDSTYTITLADKGHTIRALVWVKAKTGINLGGDVATNAYTTTVTGFTPPQVQTLYILGAHTVGSTLSADFLFYDAEDDTEGTHSYQWVRDNNYILGDTLVDHIVTEEDLESNLAVFVTPRALTGDTLTGATVSTSINIKRYFTDPRDSKTYRAVTIDGTIWMAENLNYDAGTGSVCYQNNNGNCTTYGRLYDFTTANSSCPDGWSLPSDGHWEDLASSTDINGTGKDVDSWRDVGRQLKATSWAGGLDTYEFSALPGGSGWSNASFTGAGNEGYFWTSTVAPDIASTPAGYVRAMNSVYKPYLFSKTYQQVSNMSVRCIRTKASLSVYNYVEGGTSNVVGDNGSLAGDTVTVTVNDTSLTLGFEKWVVDFGSVQFVNNDSISDTVRVILSEYSRVRPQFIEDHFYDARDLVLYKKVQIGTQTWMAENLKYEPASGSSNPWGNAQTIGRHYTWEAAKTACPTDWHLPTDAEWETMATFIANETGLTGKSGTAWASLAPALRAVGEWGATSATDTHGFSARQSGGTTTATGVSFDATWATWWTSDGVNATTGYTRGMSTSNLFSGPATSNAGNNYKYSFAVRCIAD